MILLIFAPHTDPSESRYAEIARKMAETGDWITPQFDYGVPFWGKPPLSMWMSALGIELFGANEFGSRIFIFLAAVAVLALVAVAARRELDRSAGWTTAAILMAMPLFFYCSAAVMTDLALLLGTTLTMVCFRHAMDRAERWAGYGMFIGLAIGLLAKGPLGLVISLPPIFGWLLLTRRWRAAWTALPWFSGSLLMIVVALPWYVAAEHKTPGFLNYFLVGEHWKRFTVRGWQGDLYGNAHPVAPGMIWIYLLLGAFPWAFGLIKPCATGWRNLREWATAGEGRRLYWLLWALWPVVFFTSARNIISTYPLPALPAFAILLAEIFNPHEPVGVQSQKMGRFFTGFSAITLILVSWALAVSLFFPQFAPKRSERDLVSRFNQERSPGEHLIYYGTRKYSAEFYSEGAIESTISAECLVRKIEEPGRIFVALPSRWLSKMPAGINGRLRPVADWNGGYALFVERADTAPSGAPLANH